MTAQPPAATLRRAMARRGAPFRPHGGQARCAADSSRHRGEGGRDRAAVLVAARRLRPWSRRPGTARRRSLHDGPRLIRVRSRGSRSTAETTTPSCSCAMSRPRFTASNRSRRRCSKRFWARRIDLDEARSARRQRACCAGAPAGAGARRSACRRQSGVSRRACGAVRVRSGRVADRDRQQGRPRRCRLPAGGRTAVCTRSASRIFGWTSARPSCCCKPRESSSTRASCPS